MIRAPQQLAALWGGLNRAGHPPSAPLCWPRAEGGQYGGSAAREGQYAGGPVPGKTGAGARLDRRGGAVPGRRGTAGIRPLAGRQGRTTERGTGPVMAPRGTLFPDFRLPDSGFPGFRLTPRSGESGHRPRMDCIGPAGGGAWGPDVSGAAPWALSAPERASRITTRSGAAGPAMAPGEFSPAAVPWKPLPQVRPVLAYESCASGKTSGPRSGFDPGVVAEFGPDDVDPMLGTRHHQENTGPRITCGHREHAPGRRWPFTGGRGPRCSGKLCVEGSPAGHCHAGRTLTYGWRYSGLEPASKAWARDTCGSQRDSNLHGEPVTGLMPRSQACGVGGRSFARLHPGRGAGAYNGGA